MIKENMTRLLDDEQLKLIAAQKMAECYEAIRSGNPDKIVGAFCSSMLSGEEDIFSQESHVVIGSEFVYRGKTFYLELQEFLDITQVFRMYDTEPPVVVAIPGAYAWGSITDRSVVPDCILEAIDRWLDGYAKDFEAEIGVK